MPRTLSFVVLLLILSVSALFAQIVAVPNSMNFQGRLTKPNGTPVPDGTYSVRFSLWNALAGGTEHWNKTVADMQVKNGTFVVMLNNFPAATFNDNLWLEIKIGDDAALTPRTPLVSVPYAFKADSVKDGSITAASIAPGTITAANVASNGFNQLVWLLGGNSGVANGFIGTTDNNPLNFRVNNQRVLRIEPATFIFDPANGYTVTGFNIIGGLSANNITAGSVGTTINGGGWFEPHGNIIYANRANVLACTVGGGALNVAGDINQNSNTAAYITVSGGYGNYANAWGVMIAGGQNSNATGLYDVISGGTGNIARDFASVIAGGQNNVASGTYAVVGGGYQSTASGYAATVSGGQFNIASNSYSFAAGRRANAQHVSAFVWADSTDTNFASTANNQFNIRASGGVRIFSKSNLSTGVTLAANDGAWSSVSDHNAKTDFRAIDTLDILERLVTIPITTWNYKGVENPILHIGPMAQDFYAAFGVGMDDKHISTIDADGVALAAIQGLNRKFKDVEANNAALKKENAELKTVLADILKRLEKVEANSHR